MKKIYRRVAVVKDVQCGQVICAYKKPGDQHIRLCEHYSHRSRMVGFCDLTKENLVVHRVLDGIPIAKRGWKCLESEHLWEQLNEQGRKDQVSDRNGDRISA